MEDVQARENSMCKRVEALSNPVFGGSKKVAIPENEIKGEDNWIRLMRSSETKLWRAAAKNLFRPVIFHDGIGHTGDTVLTPGLVWLGQRPPLVHWAFAQPQIHLGKHPAPHANRRAVTSSKVLTCITLAPEGQAERRDSSHPVHVDNCILNAEALMCIKEPPAYTFRDYRCQLTLKGPPCPALCPLHTPTHTEIWDHLFPKSSPLSPDPLGWEIE